MPKIVDHEEQRKAIATATIQWIAKHGIETLSQRNIAKLCGRSKGGIQYYFPDRRSLLLGAVEQVTHLRIKRELLAQQQGNDEPREQLRRRLSAALPLGTEQQDAWRARLSLYVYAQQDKGVEDILASHARDILKSGTELVRACQEAGSINPDLDPYYVFQHLQAIVAGIAVAALAMGTSPTSLRVFIRGLGPVDSQLTQDPPVGIYVNGIYIARTMALSLDFPNLERIEILRGPQGTLYGLNFTDGTINIITKRPSDQLTASQLIAWATSAPCGRNPISTCRSATTFS